MVRLLDGVILEESRRNESFENHLLDYPVYTKPKEFMGYFVPEVLLSGNHAEIEKFRQQQRIEKTRRKRPDLLENGGGYDGEANL